MTHKCWQFHCSSRILSSPNLFWSQHNFSFISVMGSHVWLGNRYISCQGSLGSFLMSSYQATVLIPKQVRLLHCRLPPTSWLQRCNCTQPITIRHGSATNQPDGIWGSLWKQFFPFDSKEAAAIHLSLTFLSLRSGLSGLPGSFHWYHRMSTLGRHALLLNACSALPRAPTNARPK